MDDSRAEAIGRLKHRQSFLQSALIFAAIAVVLVVIWAISGGGYFWPVYPIIGLAIALGAQAFQFFGQRPISEDAIQREMQRRPAGS